MRPNLWYIARNMRQMLASTPTQQTLLNIVRETLNTNYPPTKWDHALKVPHVDGFLAVLEPTAIKRVFAHQPTSFNSWVRHIDDWLMKLWDPRRPVGRGAIVLSVLWDN